MATRPKAVIESRNGEKFSPITITKNVLTDDGRNLHDILSDRKEDMMTPTIENSSSMFKVGQGDNVDYSANVVNGAYESLVFKGKSLVNLVRLNSKITSSSPIDINILPIDHTKTYLLKVRINEAPTFTNESDSQLALKVQYFSTSDAKGFTAISNSNMVKGYELTKIVAPTLESNTNGKFSLWIPRYISGTLDVDVMFIPYQEGMEEWDIPYFEGICDCKSPILSNVGKNLFTTRDSNVDIHSNHKLDVLGENHIEITAITNETGWLYTTYKVKGLIPNTTYILSGDVSEGVNNSSGSKGVMLIHDFNTSTSTASVDSSNRAIRYTTPKDVTNVRVLFYSSLNRTPNKIGDTYSFKNIQLEKAQDITAYEPYKSNTTTFDQKDGKTIVLRSLPDGICDTLNVETREYTRKIGEIIIDGSEDWKLSTRFSSTYNSYYFVLNETFRKNIKYVNDKYQSLLSGEDLGKNIGLYMGNSNNNIAPFISSDKMTLSEFKEYLQQNPVTVQYELATPIVSTIDVQGFPYAYANGHVQLSSGSIGQSLTPKVEYSVATNRNGQIRSNQKMVERHQKQLDRLQAMILTNLVNTQYEQTLTNLKYDLKNVREEVK